MILDRWAGQKIKTLFSELKSFWLKLIALFSQFFITGIYLMWPYPNKPTIIKLEF